MSGLLKSIVTGIAFQIETDGKSTTTKVAINTDLGVAQAVFQTKAPTRQQIRAARAITFASKFK